MKTFLGLNLLFILLYLALIVGYLKGENEGWDLGKRVGYAECTINKAGFQFKHNGVVE